MNTSEIHPFINYFPVLGSLIVFLILFLAIALKNNSMKVTGLILMIIVGLSVIPIEISRHGSESMVENYPDISQDVIEENLTDTSMRLSIICSIFSVLALYFIVKDHPRARISVLIVLILALSNFLLITKQNYESENLQKPHLKHEEVD